MKKILLLNCLLLHVFISFAETIIVKNGDELNEAGKKARPGDIVLLKNGEWKDVTIKLSCSGTISSPILFKAETAGKVLITGKSQLRLGGTYITVDGLYFLNGYAGDAPVINFRIDSKQLANNCRVTNCVINDFNNPERMEDNNWVAFYGKNNRLDHCSFKDKKNMGVLIAVILDDERSRENFHSIDHNYFGRRPPLGSNGGEIIRVGVSQHCEFNSNTQITDNFFEYCDGETEIISIKSCSNAVKRNVFKESQGSVVLRHGNYNTVENNVFLGNGKAGTGGVRVINKGQWVVNNFFYKCRGVDFRAPLSIMNGIPNSPAHRYVQVTDAVITNNTFYDCSTASFCEGSDSERTLPPDNVFLANNIFCSTKEKTIYKAFDKINGFNFSGNVLNDIISQSLPPGFTKTSIAIQTNTIAPLPFTVTKQASFVPDSLQQLAKDRLQHGLSVKPGFGDLQLLKKVHANAVNATGAKWFATNSKEVTAKISTVKCFNAEEVYKQLETKEPVIIELTSAIYTLSKPFYITKNVVFHGNSNSITIIVPEKIQGVFVVAGNGQLVLSKLNIAGQSINAEHFISSDNKGSSAHYALTVNHCQLAGLGNDTQCRSIFYANKSMIADSIVFINNQFVNNHTDGIMMADEKDDKGYYNAEKIRITGNAFTGQKGTLLKVYRGGNDESTMGPNLTFTNNNIKDCRSEKGPLISFTGVQVTDISNNLFSNTNNNAVLIEYNDKVRARHIIENNRFDKSGQLITNAFVTEKNNNTTN